MLLKVGVYMMAFALVLTIVTVAVVVAFREEPEKAVAEPISEASEAPEPLIRQYFPPKPKVKKAESRPAGAVRTAELEEA